MVSVYAQCCEDPSTARLATATMAQIIAKAKTMREREKKEKKKEETIVAAIRCVAKT